MFITKLTMYMYIKLTRCRHFSVEWLVDPLCQYLSHPHWHTDSLHPSMLPCKKTHNIFKLVIFKVVLSGVKQDCIRTHSSNKYKPDFWCNCCKTVYIGWKAHVSKKLLDFVLVIVLPVHRKGFISVKLLRDGAPDKQICHDNSLLYIQCVWCFFPLYWF